MDVGLGWIVDAAPGWSATKLDRLGCCTDWTSYKEPKLSSRRTFALIFRLAILANVRAYP